MHTSIFMQNCLTLALSAVVVTNLEAGLIFEMAFTKEHEVVTDIPNV